MSSLRLTLVEKYQRSNVDLTLNLLSAWPKIIFITYKFIIISKRYFILQPALDQAELSENKKKLSLSGSMRVCRQKKKIMRSGAT